MSHNLTQHLLHALRFTPAFVFPLLVAMSVQYIPRGITGCSRFGGGNRTCIGVLGQELKISLVEGNFKMRTPRRKLCSWHYNIAFMDDNNFNYHTVRGTRRSGCYSEGKNLIVRYTPYQIFRPGRVCAQLYDTGFYVDAACVNITP
jgi:hypothetical protein